MLLLLLLLLTHSNTDTTVKNLTIGLKHVLPVQIRESSGLCYTNESLWTFGDGGNPNKLFKIDTTTGAILQIIEISNFPNIDWEDITADELYIYIGDFGNNYGNRKDLKIIRIRKSDLNNKNHYIKMTGEAIRFRYADQSNFSKKNRTNFDCESLISIDSSLYIFTKDGVDLKTRCYRISKIPGSYTVKPYTSFDTKGKITAAAYNSKTKEIALLGYQQKKTYPFVWFLNGFKDDHFFSGTRTKIIFGGIKDWQTEGLDYVSENRLFMSCESSTSQPASLYFVQKNN